VIVNLLNLGLTLFVWAMFLLMIMSFIPATSVRPFEQFRYLLIRVTEPVLGPVRRLLPMLRVGGVGLDFSPLVVIIIADFLIGFLRSL
jgi:YggT family protein